MEVGGKALQFELRSVREHGIASRLTEMRFQGTGPWRVLGGAGVMDSAAE